MHIDTRTNLDEQDDTECVDRMASKPVDSSAATRTTQDPARL
jgi:hypothetical protein